MNIIEAIEITRDVAASNWHADDEQRTAMAMVADLIAAYDALAPKPEDWIDGARYYAIDADGTANWHTLEPTPFDAVWESGTGDYIKCRHIPDGVDWRLCIWQRPEAA